MRTEHHHPNGESIVHLHQWNSLVECLNDVPYPTAQAITAMEAVDYSNTRRDPNGWLGVQSIEALDEAIRSGWPEGIALLEGLASEELPTPTSMKRRRVRSDFGDEYDIHSGMRGEHDRAWSIARRSPRRGLQRVTVMCEIAASSKEKARDLVWRGVAAIKLSDALEQAGYQVQIVGVNGTDCVSRDGSESAALMVTIKDFDQPLDLASLAATIVLPGFKRTYFHRHQHSHYASTHPALGMKSHVLLDWLFIRAKAEGNAVRIRENITSRAACQTFLRGALSQIEEFNRAD